MASNMDRLGSKLASSPTGPINIKPSRRGLLHQNLGVAAGAKIPVAKIQKAANSDNAALARRAQFALNARSWNK